MKNTKDGLHINCKDCCCKISRDKRKEYRNNLIIRDLKENKKCRICGIIKDIAEFHKNKSSFDGRAYICSDCACNESKRYRGMYKEINEIGNICHDVKRCSHCKEEKEIENFNSDISSFGGFDKYCKECRSIMNKEYSEKNKDRISEFRKINYIKNRDLILDRQRKSMEDIATFARFGHRLTSEEEAIEGENGALLIKCTHCKKYHVQKNKVVLNRIAALNTPGGSESRIYCSDQCKQDCDIYWAKLIPKSLRNIASKSRCNQNRVREILLDIQFDEMGCNWCDKCGDIFGPEDLFFHHNIPIGDDPTEYDNAAHYMLVCKDHHEHKGCLGNKYE
ncbi:MAG: hypothetical protein WC055_00265 [Melioribacteraceae bacterium]